MGNKMGFAEMCQVLTDGSAIRVHCYTAASYTANLGHCKPAAVQLRCKMRAFSSLNSSQLFALELCLKNVKNVKDT